MVTDPGGRAPGSTGRALDGRSYERMEQRAAGGPGDWALHHAVWEWDLETDRLWWGPGFESSFGWDPNGLPAVPEAWFGRIHPEDRDLVLDELEARFEPFEGLEVHGEGEGEGTGLGLYVARGIVEAHGGLLEAPHESEGVRSVLELPLGPDGDEAQRPAKGTRALGVTTS